MDDNVCTQTLDSTTRESQSKQLSQVKLAPLVELDLTCSLFPAV